MDTLLSQVESCKSKITLARFTFTCAQNQCFSFYSFYLHKITLRKLLCGSCLMSSRKLASNSLTAWPCKRSLIVENCYRKKKLRAKKKHNPCVCLCVRACWLMHCRTGCPQPVCRDCTLPTNTRVTLASVSELDFVLLFCCDL